MKAKDVLPFKETVDKFWKLFNDFLDQNPGPEGESKLAHMVGASIPSIRRWKAKKIFPSRAVIRLTIDQLEKYNKKRSKAKKTILNSMREGGEIPPEVRETFKKLMKNLDEGLPHPRDNIR
jgi:hypothetical protein